MTDSQYQALISKQLEMQSTFIFTGLWYIITIIRNNIQVLYQILVPWQQTLHSEKHHK